MMTNVGSTTSLQLLLRKPKILIYLFKAEPFQNFRITVKAISYRFDSTNRSTISGGGFSVPQRTKRKNWQINILESHADVQYFKVQILDM